MFLNLTATGFVLEDISFKKSAAVSDVAVPTVLSTGTFILTSEEDGTVILPDKVLLGPNKLPLLTLEEEGRLGKVSAEYNVLFCEPSVNNLHCDVDVLEINRF